MRKKKKVGSVLGRIGFSQSVVRLCVASLDHSKRRAPNEIYCRHEPITVDMPKPMSWTWLAWASSLLFPPTRDPLSEDPLKLMMLARLVWDGVGKDPWENHPQGMGFSDQPSLIKPQIHSRHSAPSMLWLMSNAIRSIPRSPYTNMRPAGARSS